MKSEDLINSKWVKEHPFLKEVAYFFGKISEFEDGFKKQKVRELDFEKSKEEFLEGKPLILTSKSDYLDYDYASEYFEKLIDFMAKDENLPKILREKIKILSKLTCVEDGFSKGSIKGAVEGNLKHNLELLEFFAWTAVRFTLKPYIKKMEEFESKNDSRCCSCPTCGSAAVAARIEQSKSGSVRYLHCAHCGTLWRYKRIGCPYCENEDQAKLGVKEVENESNVRVDTCSNCMMYIKTFLVDDKDKEDIALEDWATLHVDALFKESTFKKAGAIFGL